MTTIQGDAAVVIADYLARNRYSNDPHGLAFDLHSAGLLQDGWANVPNPDQAAVNILGCRLPWSASAAIVERLRESELLVPAMHPVNPED